VHAVHRVHGEALEQAVLDHLARTTAAFLAGKTVQETGYIDPDAAARFHEEDLTVLYQHAFTGSHSDAILYRVQPNLNVVAVFPINKDLKMVIEDNFQDVRFTPIMQPMWNYLHKRSFTGIYHKL